MKAYNICGAFAGLQSLAPLYHSVAMPAPWKTHGRFLIPQLASVCVLMKSYEEDLPQTVKNQHDDFKEKKNK